MVRPGKIGRGRFRVTLRGFLAGMAVVAVGLGFWADRARRERLAAQWVARMGGTIWYEDQLDEDGGIRKGSTPAGPAWLRARLGDEYFRRIRTVSLHRPKGGPIAVEDLKLLEGLTGLRTLWITAGGVDDRHVARIVRLRGLDDLSLDHTGLTDRGLAQLCAMKGLRGLSLEGTAITDDGLAPLRALVGLEYLSLAETKVEGPGLAQLAGMARLESLYLHATEVGDAGLDHLAPLENLDDLSLGPKVTDAGLARVAKLSRLKVLQLTNSRITGAGLDATLPRLPLLTHLGLHYTHVNPEDMDRLQAEYPRVVIARSY